MNVPHLTPSPLQFSLQDAILLTFLSNATLRLLSEKWNAHISLQQLMSFAAVLSPNCAAQHKPCSPQQVPYHPGLIHHCHPHCLCSESVQLCTAVPVSQISSGSYLPAYTTSPEAEQAPRPLLLSWLWNPTCVHLALWLDSCISSLIESLGRENSRHR